MCLEQKYKGHTRGALNVAIDKITNEIDLRRLLCFFYGYKHPKNPCINQNFNLNAY